MSSRTELTSPDTERTGPPPAMGEVVCGRIVGVFGIRGEVKVLSYTEPTEQLLLYRPWRIRLPEGGSFLVQHLSYHHRGQKLIVALGGFTDRNRSEALVGGEISVPRHCFQPLSEGQFYWVDLLGLEVIDESGIRLGTVSDLTRGPAGDCLVVTGATLQLIPFIWGITIMAVELESRRIRVRSAEGTLPGAL